MKGGHVFGEWSGKKTKPLLSIDCRHGAFGGGLGSSMAVWKHSRPVFVESESQFFQTSTSSFRILGK